VDDSPYFIHSLRLTGFRAYLRPKTFDFSEKRCLAIFAPNGYGKSSVIDALEFMFSTDGTLERLGQRTIHNQAGPAALAHNQSEEAKVAPSVEIGFIKGKNITSGPRSAAGPKRPMPQCASVVSRSFIVSPIIRGHTLRTFVEEHTAEQRYTDVASWLQLGPLVGVQKNLRSLRTQVKAAAEDTDALRRINTQTARETSQAVTQWDDTAVLACVNSSVLAPLDKTLLLNGLNPGDSVFQEVLRRAQVEERQVGLAGLRQLRQTAVALWVRNENEETHEVALNGAIPTFEAALATLSVAMQLEATERGKAAGAVFQALWKAAEPLFAEGVAPPELCPICATPLGDTAAGNSRAIRTHLATHLGELGDYAKAKRALDDATAATHRARSRLGAALPTLAGLLGEDDSALKAMLGAYCTAVDAWTSGEGPASADLVDALSALINRLDATIANIEAKQGEHTYAKAKGKIDRLVELQNERKLALRTQVELVTLSDALTAQAGIISGEIRQKVQNLLATLQTPMNDIYKRIQGADAAPIRLELPAEDDTNQQRLNLVIDFADNRVSVQPGGYLSDSQIHSLALALRLAAIKQFNSAAPIVALDDIVTSYDADHRRKIAGLIAAVFDDCQILLATHDERFFNYLKDQLAPAKWHFTRIIGVDRTYGPRFADHKVSDAMIAARWDAGESAANEMRQAEEEWLLSVCRDFGASMRIRPLEKAYSYERSELAAALAAFLNGVKLTPQLIAGVNNRFLASLQKGEIENFGSHFQDGPYGYGSIGDERARWDEFKVFRTQFSCQKCSRTRFKRPADLKRPVCAHEGCEAQFEFVANPSAAPVAGRGG
jgi:energy-coupling factor transporter ATP-binding protein EcfA2